MYTNGEQCEPYLLLCQVGNGLRGADERFRIPEVYDIQRRTDWVQSLWRDQSCPSADREEGRPKLGPSLRTASQGRDSRVRERRIEIPPSFCREAKREGQVMHLGGRKKAPSPGASDGCTGANAALNHDQEVDAGTA